VSDVPDKLERKRQTKLKNEEVLREALKLPGFSSALRERQEAAVLLCGMAFDLLQQAKKAYGDAVMAANDIGASNTAIAREVGMSETAIRLYIKRRKETVE